MEPSREDLESLAEKLNGLELSDPERTVLGQLLGAAVQEEPEVEGFSKRIYVGNLPVVVQGFNIGMPPMAKEETLEFPGFTDRFGTNPAQGESHV